jgi:superfamily II DNA/RNA helicase
MNSGDGSVSFCGVKLVPPLSTNLAKMQVLTPTGIQAAAISPLTMGCSAILHAETGSGKTLAYLVPLLKRLYENGQLNQTPRQALILVPTKELAVQVAAEITALLSEDMEALDTSCVSLCITSKRNGLTSLTAPIVVGTPFKVLDTLRASESTGVEDASTSLSSFSYVVLDEVDRLLNVLGRYASNNDKREQRRHQNPALEVLQAITTDRDSTDVQIVAASATVGRPMRRELFKALQGSYRGSGGYDIPILRPAVSESESGAAAIAAGRHVPRAVGIPRTIRHTILLFEDQGSQGDISSSSGPSMAKVAQVSELWKGAVKSRAMLFLPSESDVSQALGMLKFMKVSAKNLQDMLGIEKPRPVALNKSKHGPKKPRKSSSGGGDAVAVSTPLQARLGGLDEMITRAARNRLGATSLLQQIVVAESSTVEGKPTPHDASIDASAADGPAASSEKEKEKKKMKEKEMFVVPVSGARGLHLDGVETVFISSPPLSMDEYLHMAGRTGRAGKDGLVVTLASLDELKRMQSWQTALAIDFDIFYSAADMSYL